MKLLKTLMLKTISHDNVLVIFSWTKSILSLGGFALFNTTVSFNLQFPIISTYFKLSAHLQLHFTQLIYKHLFVKEVLIYLNNIYISNTIHLQLLYKFNNISHNKVLCHKRKWCKQLLQNLNLIYIF